MNDDVTLIDRGLGMAECRICGLLFIPELPEDQERHEHEHRRILWGGFPYEIREILKRAGWEAIEDAKKRKGQADSRELERGKRAVVFGTWARAVANGIPENEFERYMAAQFAHMDAIVAGDKEAIAAAEEAMAPWIKYGG